jgi:uncharacterized protein
MSFIWIILSYLAGSIPFGFIIGKLSGKNVLEVGWKKTSGSNVYKNVGKKQGILTGLLDAAKGFLMVWLAKKMGFSSEIQVLAGVAAIVGHNWSIFLKFSGGRGIGTLAGAFLALSPKVFGLAFIPFFIFVFTWNAAIATIVFLIFAIIFSLTTNQFHLAGYFTLLSLIPISIKRLSPISEILKNKEKRWQLFTNRIIFDRDELVRDLRINRIFREEKSKRLSLALKIISYPLLIPPKISWKLAKYGFNMAKKPMSLLRGREKSVFELGAEDLKKMMVASAKKIVVWQEEINRMNVFPVADKDTGYNLAATLLGIEGLISRKKYQRIRELAEDIKQAAMINARGNAGMIFTAYLIELLDRVKHLETINASHLAFAMARGIKAARSAVAQPVEGTVLDILSAAGNKAYELTVLDKEKKRQKKDIIKVLEEAFLAAKKALDETPDKLAVLKQNNVVDAGGFGFFKIMEAWIESLKGQEILQKAEDSSFVAQDQQEQNLEFRYEVVLGFINSENIPTTRIEEELGPLGNSLEIIEFDDSIKLHIHTNEPEAVTVKFKNFPGYEEQIEDMSGQESQVARKPLGLVLDQVADLPQEFLERYEITEVPFTTRFPNGEIINSKEEIYQKIEEAIKNKKPLPTTSAPSFKNFHTAYSSAFKKFEKILAITVSSRLSGTYSSARIARSVFRKPEKLDIYVFDSFTAEAGEGLVALRAQELISKGKTLDQVVEELKIFCPKVTLIACIEDFRFLASGGRVRVPRILLRPIFFMQKIGLRVLIGLKSGSVRFFGINFGKDVAQILSEEIDRQRKGRKIIMAITHADNEKASESLRAQLEKNPDIKIAFVSSASAVVATHTGKGALIAAFYPSEV